MFLEGQLRHVYSLADNCVLVNARADVCDYLKDWCNGAAAFFRERIIDDFSPRYREMLDALDLRVLILHLTTSRECSEGTVVCAEEAMDMVV